MYTVKSFTRKGNQRDSIRPRRPRRKKRPTIGQRKRLRAATAKKFVKKPKGGFKKPAKTSAHAKAGLHRMGKSGNRYSDTKGNVFHRVGKGKKSRFVKGEPPKRKGRTKTKKGRKTRTRKPRARKRVKARKQRRTRK